MDATRKRTAAISCFPQITGSLIRRLFALLLALALLNLTSVPGQADQKPLWWDQAQAEADDHGYGLTRAGDLQGFMDSKEDFLLLDVRPDYEFQRAHIPGARNLEFHLGDRLKLYPEKAKAFKSLAGPNKKRLVVVYCRSYR